MNRRIDHRLPSNNDVPSEFQKSFGRVRDTIFGPRKEMELGDRSRLSRADVLQVERTDQVIVAPDVFADQMDLFERMNQSSIGWNNHLT